MIESAFIGPSGRWLPARPLRSLRALSSVTRIADNPTRAAERRHLTVMICDLVKSTALSARLDPEDMGAVIDAYHAACARIVQTYEGFLCDFRGDGILSYFGYPRAHEDDAERTVRAALDIAAAVRRLETPAAEPLAVRIGIATGLVVVGDLSREGALARARDRRYAEPCSAPSGPGRARDDRRSPPPRAGCSAICSVCATSVGTRSRASPSRSQRGWLRACRLPRAASRAIRDGGSRPISSAARTRSTSC